MKHVWILAFVPWALFACRPAQQGSPLREEESLRRDDPPAAPVAFTEAEREQGGEKLGCACAKTADGALWEPHVYYATSERAGYKVRIAAASAFAECLAAKEASTQCAL